MDLGVVSKDKKKTTSFRRQFIHKETNNCLDELFALKKKKPKKPAANETCKLYGSQLRNASTIWEYSTDYNWNIGYLKLSSYKITYEKINFKKDNIIY